MPLSLADAQPIETAPRDGSRIEVFLGRDQTWVPAYWAKQTQAWVRWLDPERRTLHRVTHWRPARHD
jgi:hypothetical protein